MNNHHQACTCTCGCKKPVRHPALRKAIGIALALFALGAVALQIIRERKAGAEAPNSADIAAPTNSVGKTVTEVFYFHGNRRCHTCNGIEALLRETIGENCQEGLADGSVRFISVNIDERANEHFVRDFRLSSRIGVIRRGTRVIRLDQVWELAHDPQSFREYVTQKLREVEK
ncbi:MAG: nitrophenyl compound nitroreductase subunit ArsF family protein [Kiritimatiellia bacterium]